MNIEWMLIGILRTPLYKIKPSRFVISIYSFNEATQEDHSALKKLDIINLIIILCLGLITFPFAFFVYFKIVTNDHFKHNYTFRLVVIAGTVDFIVYVANLIFLQLTTFTIMNGFFDFLNENGLSPVMSGGMSSLCFLQVLLSLAVAVNRLLFIVKRNLLQVHSRLVFIVSIAASGGITVLFSLIVYQPSFTYPQTYIGAGLYAHSPSSGEFPSYLTLSLLTLSVSAIVFLVSISLVRSVFSYRRQISYDKEKSLESGLIVVAISNFVNYILFVSAISHGPYRLIAETLQLTYNDFSWNQCTNLLYIESPSGVGFSHSNDTNKDSYDDVTTARMNRKVLRDFMTRVHPRYASRDFYLTGESYAGLHILLEYYNYYLTREILKHSQSGEFTNPNFKGIAMGNAHVDHFSVEIATALQLYSLGMIPEKFVNPRMFGKELFGAWNQVIEGKHDSISLSLVWHIAKPSRNAECIPEGYMNGDDVQIHMNAQKNNLPFMANAQEVDTPHWFYLSDHGGARTSYVTNDGRITMDFLTVRGSSHSVPITTPDRAFQLINNFISSGAVINYSKKILRK
ncbi:hypothetical protein PRIPAC_95993 [Pristionchus pacificus]|uniref:Carboxypeptidase n=1 Tax=Pristionchus pacificus TaxID=54126 RepID=A0A2A6BBZ8_PRIPA|nr:hypothetical protein PRIPAC_95993 [Pristionchus pacificus]|eukprot:PDM63400.1 Peptidase [Pristionchus pacificus]